jgi:hypothetical protein
MNLMSGREGSDVILLIASDNEEEGVKKHGYVLAEEGEDDSTE